MVGSTFDSSSTTFDSGSQTFDGGTVQIVPGAIRIVIQPDSPCSQTLSQLSAAKNLYQIDVSAKSVLSWVPNASVPAYALIGPSANERTGFIYQNGNANGQTGRSEPAWPAVSGETVTDGSLTWTARVPPLAGVQDSIESATWTQVEPPDAELTIATETNSSLVASAYVSGGTSGNVYTVLVAVLMVSGAIYPAKLILTIL